MAKKERPAYLGTLHQALFQGLDYSLVLYFTGNMRAFLSQILISQMRKRQSVSFTGIWIEQVR